MEILEKIKVVRARCMEVFEDQELCTKWLNTPNMVLGGVAPVSMLETDDGMQTVLGVLGRIEHGIIS